MVWDVQAREAVKVFVDAEQDTWRGLLVSYRQQRRAYILRRKPAVRRNMSAIQNGVQAASGGLRSYVACDRAECAQRWLPEAQVLRIVAQASLQAATWSTAS